MQVGSTGSQKCHGVQESCSSGSRYHASTSGERRPHALISGQGDIGIQHPLKQKKGGGRSEPWFSLLFSFTFLLHPFALRTWMQPWHSKLPFKASRSTLNLLQGSSNYIDSRIASIYEYIVSLSSVPTCNQSNLSKTQLFLNLHISQSEKTIGTKKDSLSSPNTSLLGRYIRSVEFPLYS